MRNRKINPKRAKTIISGISGSVSRIKQITVIDMPSEELDSAMTLEARKHVPLDGTDTIIDYQVLGSNPIEIELLICSASVQYLIRSHRNSIENPFKFY